ncbi:MAG: DUF5050 domain-containing protein, partial [Lachnospiraceae bacterium]|nr:DUF5050 domain-containing protein [Lachnospiraceae bacterium]
LDGEIYFANPYDNDYLYKMDGDLTNVKKLVTVPVSMINGAGNFLYYFQDTGKAKGPNAATGLGYVANTRSLTRVHTNGKRAKGLENAAVANVMLMGNYLFTENYDSDQNKMNLMRISLDGKNKEVVYNDWINPAGARNGMIYYNGTSKDHYLYAFNTETNTTQVVYPGDVWYPTPDGDYIYYLDVSNDYHICRIRLADQSVEEIIHESADLFNVQNGTVIYSVRSAKAEEHAIKRFTPGMLEPEIISRGDFQNISIVGGYVFFRAFDRYDTFYTTLSGPPAVHTFMPTVN